MLVTLKVPEEHYLAAVQWLAERTVQHADPAQQATMAALNATNSTLSALVDELQSQVEATDRENWALRERIKLDAEQTRPSPAHLLENLRKLRANAEAEADALREELVRMGRSPVEVEELSLTARGLLDGDEALTTDTLAGAMQDADKIEATGQSALAEAVRQEAMAQAVADEQARHEAPEPAQDEPAAAPEGEGPAEPEHGAHEAPEPVAPQTGGQRRGLAAAATVAAQVAGPVARFLEACCEDAAGESVPSPALLAAYNEWAKRTGEPELNNIRLGKGLSANGLERKQARGAVPGFDNKFRPIMWYGIRLKADARKQETEAVRAAIEAARKIAPPREVHRDEPAVADHITPKVLDKPAAPPILHVKTPRPPTKREQSGVTVVRANGKVTTAQAYETQDEAYREPIKPEDADGLTFDIYTDCQRGTNRPYSVADDVLALYGVDTEAIEAAIRNPQRVTIRPESKDKGYPVLSFHRGDLDVITGFRTPDRPKVMAAYVFSAAAHDVHRVNHTGGGGKKAAQGLPTTVKASVRALKERGLEIPDTWESATSPVEVRYQGKVLGKMKVHLADKSQVQGDYQRLLRQAHAIDRRQQMAGAAS